MITRSVLLRGESSARRSTEHCRAEEEKEEKETEEGKGEEDDKGRKMIKQEELTKSS